MWDHSQQQDLIMENPRRQRYSSGEQYYTQTGSNPRKQDLTDTIPEDTVTLVVDNITPMQDQIPPNKIQTGRIPRTWNHKWCRFLWADVSSLKVWYLHVFLHAVNEYQNKTWKKPWPHTKETSCIDFTLWAVCTYWWQEKERSNLFSCKNSSLNCSKYCLQSFKLTPLLHIVHLHRDSVCGKSLHNDSGKCSSTLVAFLLSC